TRLRTLSILVAAGLVFLAARGDAQVTFAVGGGATSSGGFSAEVTLGDPFAGSASSAGFAASAGFRASLPTNAPFGVLPPVSAVAGADLPVTALLQDDVLVVSASLFYQPGGASAFTEVPMTLTDAGTGEWSATIPAGDLDVRGVRYFVTASDGVNVANIPTTAPVSGLESIPVRVANHPTFDLAAVTYALAGVPLTPDDTSPLAVFDELGGFDDEVWRYGTFDPASGAYREGGAARPAAPGQGFWVIAANAATIDVNGVSTDLGDNFVITLQPGFNQIANPFAFPVSVDDFVIDPETTPSFIGWNGVAYVNDIQVLAPATGYWVFHGGTTSATLEIPPVGAGALERNRAVVPAALPADEPEAWAYAVQALAGDRRDDDNRFGVRADATSDRDAFDLPHAPHPPAGYALASLLTENGPALRTDWRARSDDGATWQLRFETDRVGENWRVELAPEGDLPDGWRLLAWPENGGAPIELTEGGELTGVATSTRTVRTWTLAAGTPEFLGQVEDDVRDTIVAGISELAFGRAFPNPSRAGEGTSFEFRVPRATTARVAIFDVSGRLVSTVLDGRIEPGIHTLRWNGRDARGSRVASGVYFVQVRAGDWARRGKVVVLD
ncbi:MAG: T9SS type A sorting domain-containing protein, partial [Gemmatimonadetes bacterium]|nr:T9SS type A sorting domain-containing protein [Gemmatimonadota bacterium]